MDKKTFKEKFLKLEYLGYLFYALGILFLFLTALWDYFAFAFALFLLAGGVICFIESYKKYREEKQLVDEELAGIAKAKMQENNYEVPDDFEIVDEKTMKMIKKHERRFLFVVMVHLAVALIGLTFLIRIFGYVI